jgi:hypothetical protein
MHGNYRAPRPIPVGFHRHGRRSGRLLARVSGRTQTLTATEFLGLGLAGFGLLCLSLWGFYAKSVDRNWLKFPKKVGA